jgi:hypothetical protein
LAEKLILLSPIKIFGSLEILVAGWGIQNQKNASQIYYNLNLNIQACAEDLLSVSILSIHPFSFGPESAQIYC